MSLVRHVSRTASVNIKDLRVGDRVIGENTAGELRGATEVDPRTWVKLTLYAELEWEDGTVDAVHVQTLQSPTWTELTSARKGASVPIPLDLDDLGLDPNDTVSISVQHVPLQTLLELMLAPLDLTWTPHGTVLVVTSEEEAVTNLITRVYSVADLRGEGPRYSDFDALVDVLVSTVASDTWVENGGPEADLRPIAGDLLVITQTPHVHLQIERLLGEMRTHRGVRGGPTGTPTGKKMVNASQRPARKTFIAHPTLRGVPPVYE